MQNIGAYGTNTTIGAYGYIPPSFTVSLLLGDRTGTKRADLTNLKWAWFDQTAPNNFTTPTDTGIAETTDANGLLEINLTGTSLVAGQYGCLAVSTSDDVDLGLYRLRVY